MRISESGPRLSFLAPAGLKRLIGGTNCFLALDCEDCSNFLLTAEDSLGASFSSFSFDLDNDLFKLLFDMVVSSDGRILKGFGYTFGTKLGGCLGFELVFFAIGASGLSFPFFLAIVRSSQWSIYLNI